MEKFVILDKNCEMDITTKKLIFIEKYIQLKNEKLVDKLSVILGLEHTLSGKSKSKVEQEHTTPGFAVMGGADSNPRFLNQRFGNRCTLFAATGLLKFPNSNLL